MALRASGSFSGVLKPQPPARAILVAIAIASIRSPPSMDDPATHVLYTAESSRCSAPTSPDLCEETDVLSKGLK